MSGWEDHKNKHENLPEITMQDQVSSESDAEFKAIYERASEVYKDLAMLDSSEDNSETALDDLELKNAKADVFMNAIVGMMRTKDHLDIIRAEKDRFQRSDELRTLNSLRQTFDISAQGLNKTARILDARLSEVGEDTPAEEVAMLQGVLQVNISAAQTVTNSFSKLIELERKSGIRQWGTANPRAVGSSGSIKLIEREVQKIENNQGYGSEAPREVDTAELMKFINNN